MDPKLLTFIIALLPVYLLLAHFFKRQRIVKDGYSTTGEIVNFQTENDNGRFAIIRFKTLSGEVIEKKYHSSVRFRTKIGDKVPIVYDPSEPTNFYINTVWEKRMILLFAALSAILLLGSILISK